MVFILIQVGRNGINFHPQVLSFNLFLGTIHCNKQSKSLPFSQFMNHQVSGQEVKKGNY